MKNKITTGIITTCLILVITAGMLHAGTITSYNAAIYGTRSLAFDAFDTATSSLIINTATPEDFTANTHFFSANVLNTASASSDPSPFVIQSGVDYSADSLFPNPGPFLINAGGTFTDGFLAGFNGLTTTLTMDYTSGPISAFGFDTNGFMGSSFDITIDFSDKTQYANSFAIQDNNTDVLGDFNGFGGMEFFGFTSSLADISSVSISGIQVNPNDPVSPFSFAIDNHIWGAPGTSPQNPDPPVIPEPATIMLLGIGMIGLVGVAVRRKNKRMK